MGVIQTYLTVVKEESALASKVPYIVPIAGILLKAIMMHVVCLSLLFYLSWSSQVQMLEVKQSKGER